MLGVPFCETLPHPASFLGFTVATVAVVIFISIIMSMVVIRWCLKLQRWVAIHVYAIPLVFRGHNRHCMRHRIPLPYSDRGAHLLLQKQVNSQACHQLCNMHFAVIDYQGLLEISPVLTLKQFGIFFKMQFKFLMLFTITLIFLYETD